MVGIGLVGAYIHFYVWNRDERLDTAITEASRVVIQIFYLLLAVIGTLFIVIGTLNESILWEIGAALVISALILIYMQAVISGIYADKMS